MKFHKGHAGNVSRRQNHPFEKSKLSRKLQPLASQGCQYLRSKLRMLVLRNYAARPL